MSPGTCNFCMAAFMKKSTSAVLLSLLIFPGAGHFLLRRPARGCLLVAAALLPVGIIVRDAMQQALAIVDKIQRGEIPLDQAAIERAVAHADAASSTLAWCGVAIVWLIAAIDAYRIGRRLDASAPQPNPVAE
jgi:hypothetical protein